MFGKRGGWWCILHADDILTSVVIGLCLGAGAFFCDGMAAGEKRRLSKWVLCPLRQLAVFRSF